MHSICMYMAKYSSSLFPLIFLLFQAFMYMIFRKLCWLHLEKKEIIENNILFFLFDYTYTL